MSSSCWLSSCGRITLLSIGLLVLSSCALFSDPHLDADAPESSDFERVVLLPMNYDSSPRPEIAAGLDLVGEQMREFLEARGYEVITPRTSVTLALWKASSDEVGGILHADGKSLDKERYERARSEFVRRVLDSFPADGVIAGTVLLRKGRYRGLTLRWDGVTRPVPIRTEDSTRVGFDLRGNARGTSLRTRVFDQDGNMFFERYVGLEPIDGYEMFVSHYEPWRRKDLFLDETLIREGVEVSFQPWLVEPYESE